LSKNRSDCGAFLGNNSDTAHRFPERFYEKRYKSRTNSGSPQKKRAAEGPHAVRAPSAIAAYFNGPEDVNLKSALRCSKRVLENQACDLPRRRYGSEGF
jgi:hypothetical protein